MQIAMLRGSKSTSTKKMATTNIIVKRNEIDEVQQVRLLE